MAVMRILPHPWNFTPILGGALYLGATLTTRQSLLAATFSMVLSDAVLGFHSGMWFVYGAVGLVTLLGSYLRRPSMLKLGFGSLLGSVIFFVITNFAVWATGQMYTKDLNGLLLCYSLAIPFFHHTLVSTLLYGSVFFGLHYCLFALSKLPVRSMIVLQRVKYF